jgi:hypothetical protein
MDILYTLNETGVFIWNKVDGKHTGSDIVHLLTEAFAVEEHVATRDVEELLEQMNGKIIEVL